jgi:hypothetical protein
MGIPSPRKLFWVIQIQGAFVRIENARIAQLDRCPTQFLTDKDAKNASAHIWVGEPHYVVLHRVTRAWLESVSKGETKVKVQTYRTSRN